MTPAEALLNIAASVPDKVVAAMLAAKCIALTDEPYRFSINHDIRPPKCLACPLVYDWAKRGHVGIEWKRKQAVILWLTNAFALGYTVSQTDAARKNVGYPHSIAIARRRAEIHQRPRPESDADDDIPF